MPHENQRNPLDNPKVKQEKTEAQKGQLEEGMATPSSVPTATENPTAREAWWATGHGLTKNLTQLSDSACMRRGAESLTLSHKDREKGLGDLNPGLMPKP